VSMLNLSNNELKGINYYEYKNMKKLYCLDLSNTKLNNFPELGDQFQELNTLILSNNHLKFSHCSLPIILPKLNILNFSKCHVNFETIKVLTKHGIFENLSELNLNENDLADKGLYEISLLQILKLKKLFLSQNKINYKGIEFLTNCVFIENLTHLDLGDNIIELEGMKSLLSCNLKALTHLNLECNNIEDKGIELLSKCDYEFLIIILVT